MRNEHDGGDLHENGDFQKVKCKAAECFSRDELIYYRKSDHSSIFKLEISEKAARSEVPGDFLRKNPSNGW